MSEKNQPPSDKKLREAREKGQIPKSRLLSSAAVTLCGLAATLSFSTENASRLSRWTVALLSTPEQQPTAALAEGVRVLAWCTMPTLGGAALGALVSSLAMAGFNINPSLLSPKLERLDILEGLKKLFSMRQVIDVLKNSAIAALMLWLFWSAVRDGSDEGLTAMHLGGQQAFVALLALLKPALVKASVVLLVAGVADWAWARHRHIKDLMMSRDDIKQEHKNSEGDPHQKAKRKSLHKQLASGGPGRGVKQATAVVVNPTHIAVALRYDEAECDAPYIVARAQGVEALRLRGHAATLGIPVVRDIPLARSLIHYDVGEEIPEELYQAAAALLKVAYEMNQTATERRSTAT